MASAMELAGLDPEVKRRVLDLLARARAERIEVRVTSGFRSPSKQRRLYNAWLARGRTGLPAAAPGSSTHEYGFAVDLWSPSLGRLGALAGCSGLVWAGARDPVHFDPFGFETWRAWVHGQAAEVPPYRCG